MVVFIQALHVHDRRQTDRHTDGLQRLMRHPIEGCIANLLMLDSKHHALGLDGMTSTLAANEFVQERRARTYNRRSFCQ